MYTKHTVLESRHCAAVLLDSKDKLCKVKITLEYCLQLISSCNKDQNWLYFMQLWQKTGYLLPRFGTD